MDHHYLESCATKSMMLVLMVSSFSHFFFLFLELVLTWGYFYVFSNKVLQLVFTSLVCNSIFCILFILGTCSSLFYPSAYFCPAAGQHVFECWHVVSSLGSPVPACAPSLTVHHISSTLQLVFSLLKVAALL